MHTSDIELEHGPSELVVLQTLGDVHDHLAVVRVLLKSLLIVLEHLLAFFFVIAAVVFLREEVLYAASFPVELFRLFPASKLRQKAVLVATGFLVQTHRIVTLRFLVDFISYSKNP